MASGDKKNGDDKGFKTISSERYINEWDRKLSQVEGFDIDNLKPGRALKEDFDPLNPANLPVDEDGPSSEVVDKDVGEPSEKETPVNECDDEESVIESKEGFLKKVRRNLGESFDYADSMVDVKKWHEVFQRISRSVNDLSEPQMGGAENMMPGDSDRHFKVYDSALADLKTLLKLTHEDTDLYDAIDMAIRVTPRYKSMMQNAVKKHRMELSSTESEGFAVVQNIHHDYKIKVISPITQSRLPDLSDNYKQHFEKAWDSYSETFRGLKTASSRMRGDMQKDFDQALSKFDAAAMELVKIVERKR